MTDVEIAFRAAIIADKANDFDERVLQNIPMWRQMDEAAQYDRETEAMLRDGLIDHLPSWHPTLPRVMERLNPE